jgi:hypothetical protein
MFGRWFDCTAVNEFADSAVADFVTRVPPSTIEAPGKYTASRLKGANDMIFTRAEAFARAQPPNLYKKAQLGNRVKWGLREAGYPEEFVDALTYELVTVITLASRKATKASGRGGRSSS